MTQDKRELLELAARACGINTRSDKSGVWIVESDGSPVRRWAPHLDDGDCARLEAAAKLDVVWHPRFVDVISTNPYVAVKEDYADHNNDRQAARRLASTRAAAEIGRGMK